MAHTHTHTCMCVAVQSAANYKLQNVFVSWLKKIVLQIFVFVARLFFSLFFWVCHQLLLNSVSHSVSSAQFSRLANFCASTASRVAIKKLDRSREKKQNSLHLKQFNGVLCVICIDFCHAPSTACSKKWWPSIWIVSKRDEANEGSDCGEKESKGGGGVAAVNALLPVFKWHPGEQRKVWR